MKAAQKGWKLLSIITAAVLCLTGIAYAVYAAAAITRTVGHTITYSPVLVQILGKYYIDGDDKGAKITFEKDGKADLSKSDALFTEQIVYEFAVSTKYDQVNYSASIVAAEASNLNGLKISFSIKDNGSGQQQEVSDVEATGFLGKGASKTICLLIVVDQQDPPGPGASFQYDIALVFTEPEPVSVVP